MGPLGILLIVGIAMVPVLFGLLAEDRVCRLLRASGSIPSGLAATLESGRRSSRRPVVRTFPSVRRAAYAVRSVRGDGVVLLSQGLLATLDERGLRETLDVAVARLESSRLKTVPASLALWAVLAFERSRMASVWLKPGGRDSSFGAFLLSVVAYPWLRLASRWSAGSRFESGASGDRDSLFI